MNTTSELGRLTNDGWTMLLGIDPGLRETGWGIIALNQHEGIEKFHAAGSITTKVRDDLATRLRQIFDRLVEIIQQHQPNAAAIEEVFVSRNPSSTMKLCHARGAAMLAAAHCDLEVREFHNRAIKNAIVGKGNAEKTQMLAMARFLLPNIDTDNEHAVDALCVAICAAQHRRSESRDIHP